MAGPTSMDSGAGPALTKILGASEASSSTETVFAANTATNAGAMGTFPPDIGAGGGGGFGGFAGGPDISDGGNRPHGPPAARPTLWTTQMPFSTTTLLTVGTTTVPLTLGVSSGAAPTPSISTSYSGTLASSIIYNSPGGSDASARTVNGSNTARLTASTIITGEPLSGTGFAGASGTNTFQSPLPATAGGATLQSISGSSIPSGLSTVLTTFTRGGVPTVLTTFTSGDFGAGSGATASPSVPESSADADAPASTGAAVGSGGGVAGGVGATSTRSSASPTGTALLGSQAGDGAQVTPSPVAANDQIQGQQTRLGIGVGVAIWALITVILFTWWWFHRRRQIRNDRFQRFEDFDPQRNMMEAGAIGITGPGTGAGAVVATAYGADRAASIRSGRWPGHRISRETNPGLRSHPIPEDRHSGNEEHGRSTNQYPGSETSSISDYENIHPTEPVFALPDFPLSVHTMVESSRLSRESEPTSAPPYTWTDRSDAAATRHQTTDPKFGIPSPPTVTTPNGQTVYAYVHPSEVVPGASSSIPSLPFYSQSSTPRLMRSVTNNSEYTGSEYSADPRSPDEIPALPALPANVPHGFPTGVPRGITNLTSNGFAAGQFFALPPGSGRLSAWPEDSRRRSRMASLHESMHESITEEDELSLKQSIQPEDQQQQQQQQHITTSRENLRSSTRLDRPGSGITRPMSVMSMRELIARRSFISVLSSDTRF